MQQRRDLVEFQTECVRTTCGFGSRGNNATIGITDHAQQQLGDLVHLELPKVGDSLAAMESFGLVESVKAVSEVYMPVSGEVTEVNEAPIDAPEQVNRDPYGEGWLIKISMTSQPAGLLSAAEYEDYLHEETV